MIKRKINGQFEKGSQAPYGFKKGHGMNKGNNNPGWKGDQVKYFGLHAWVFRNKGKAKKCSNCGEINNIQWANKSHEYKRELEDWIELCIPCHRAYDKGRNDIKKKIYRHDFHEV